MNRRMKQEMIDGYEIINISYDEQEETVNIEIMVDFHEVADEFDINLHGKRGGIDVKRRTGFVVLSKYFTINVL
ncbi:MAG: hypothetical protein IPJ82_19460 [Lewinellaceae bacterium]|nr:hypothetical protein [Lewinellaceae bacterium]